MMTHLKTVTAKMREKERLTPIHLTTEIVRCSTKGFDLKMVTG